MTDRTSATVVIAAPRAAVMAVIADFAAYPAWAGVRSARVIGEPGPGGRAAAVRFEIDGGVFRERFTLRYDWDGDRQVSWQIAEAGKVLTALSGSYRLAELDGGTTVTFELAVGIRIALIGPVRRRVEKAVIDAALNGLEVRVLGYG